MSVYSSLMKMCTSSLLKPLYSPQALLGSVRYESKHTRKNRFTMPFDSRPRPTRVLSQDNFTKENKEFIAEFIKDKYSGPLDLPLYERPAYTKHSFRCGVIAKKIGNHPMWLKNGKRIQVTLLEVCDNQVVKYESPEEYEKKVLLSNEKKLTPRYIKPKHHKLGALIVGADSMDPQLSTREYYRVFEESGVMPKKKIARFLITDDAKLPPGTPLRAGHFTVGDRVDVRGVTADRGFHGVMKRHAFHGQGKGRGQTKTHRRAGATGANREKNRLWPGTKAAGHVGRNQRTFRGFEIVRINTKYNVIYVRGSAVPGEVGNYVTLHDSMLFRFRRNLINKPPPFFPTYLPEYGDDALPEELFDETLHTFDEPSISFEESTKK